MEMESTIESIFEGDDRRGDKEMDRLNGAGGRPDKQRSAFTADLGRADDRKASRRMMWLLTRRKRKGSLTAVGGPSERRTGRGGTAPGGGKGQEEGQLHRPSRDETERDSRKTWLQER